MRRAVGETSPNLVSTRPPSVDALARTIADVDLPWALLVEVARTAIATGDIGSARARAEAVRGSLLRRVLNATGVLLHTNLGRAPWAGDADPAYGNVELDMVTGARGDRLRTVGQLVERATGAERAIVVNNGAAALLLALRVVAAGASVPVSRGELVEIGGRFRIPDVVRESGAALIEVGTTNRTRPADYRAALDAANPPVGAVLKVHQSNFVMQGFTESADVQQLSELGVPLVVDLGSGLLDAGCPWLDEPPSWLRGEPGVRQTLAAGASLVTFSGDKLLGGPQAGVIAGRADLVDRCARHPLVRALRPGSAVMQGLQRTLLAYLRREGRAIPLWRMATASVDELEARAHVIARKAGLPSARVRPTASVMGGGTLPGREIASIGIFLDGDRRAELRANDPPVIAVVHGGMTVCDLRTVDPTGSGEGDDQLAAALAALV